jgi:transcriptional regulator with XRE-family HTH domain
MSVDVGERLWFVRTRHKFSQRALAKRARVTNSLISLIESNQVNPSVGALKRIVYAKDATSEQERAEITRYTNKLTEPLAAFGSRLDQPEVERLHPHQ